MRRRLAGHGARPLRTACAARGAADRLRCLPRRLARQQSAQGGPQLRPAGQGHADGAGRARRGAGAGHPVLGVQPLRRLRRHGPPLRPPRRAHQRPRQGPPLRGDGGLRHQLHRRRPGLRAGRILPQGRPQARRPRRRARPDARHHGHPAGRAARQPAAGRGRRGGARAEPYVHRHVPDRQPDLAAGAALRVDGRDGRADRRADRPATGQSAARPHHLLHPHQRPLPAASAQAPGHLLRPAQPGRPGPAAPVQRRGGRNAGTRPRRRGRGRHRRDPLRLPAVDLRPPTDRHRRGHRAAQCRRHADRDPAAGHPHPEAARRHRAADQHLLHRPPAHRDDEGHRRGERLLPPLGRPARHHAGGTAAARACRAPCWPWSPPPSPRSTAR